MKLSLSPHASVVVALLTFSLTMEFSDQSDTWVDVAALLRTYLLIWARHAHCTSSGCS